MLKCGVFLYIAKYGSCFHICDITLCPFNGELISLMLGDNNDQRLLIVLFFILVVLVCVFMCVFFPCFIYDAMKLLISCVSLHVLSICIYAGTLSVLICTCISIFGITSYKCVMIHEKEYEGKMTKIQPSLGSICSTNASQSLCSITVNSFSIIPIRHVWLFKLESSLNIWNKLLNLYIFNSIVVISQLISPIDFWNSWRVCNWFLWICTSFGQIICWLIFITQLTKWISSLYFSESNLKPYHCRMFVFHQSYSLKHLLLESAKKSNLYNDKWQIGGVT